MVFEIKAVINKKIDVFDYSPSDWPYNETTKLADYADTFNVIFSISSNANDTKFDWFNNPYITANVYEVVEDSTAEDSAKLEQS